MRYEQKKWSVSLERVSLLLDEKIAAKMKIEAETKKSGRSRLSLLLDKKIEEKFQREANISSLRDGLCTNF